MRVKVLIVGGLVVGALDFLDAVVFFGLRSGTTPVRIGQSIAAGIEGRAAFSGGLPSAALGVLLHFFIAFVIVFVYYFASRAIPALTAHPIMCGAAYGVGAYCVMNYIVIPLSAAGGRLAIAPWPILANGVLIHILGIGIPTALFVSKAG
jgi:uncharacterized membrane protein YagU involved in acid resistance